jgi:hypothetical protein
MGYLIEVKLNGSLTNTQQTSPAAAGTPAYDAAHATITVLVPPVTNSMRGAGEIPTLASAAGRYGDAASASYSLGLSYNKGGAKPQGEIQLILERADGTYSVKSSSITSVAFPATKNAVIYAKATISRITMAGQLVSIEGNATVRIDAHDGCGSATCTNTGGDTLGFTVLSGKDGALYYSNNWTYDAAAKAWRTVQQALPLDAAVVIN